MKKQKNEGVVRVTRRFPDKEPRDNRIKEEFMRKRNKVKVIKKWEYR